MKNLGRININHDLKLVWIAPERTGSRTQARILSYCGFFNNGVPVSFGNNFHYTHFTDESLIPEGYEIVCGARNPYHRVWSIYKNLFNSKGITFDSFFSDWVSYGQTVKMIQNPSFPKKPKHILRMEHFFEDFSSLPFIFDFMTEKQLKMLLLHEREREPMEELSEMAKLKIQELCDNHFKVWGYEK